MLYLARVQATDTYQLGYVRTGANPHKRWDDVRERVHVHSVEGGSSVIRLLEHELRHYCTGGNWYRFPPDVAELVPIMMDDAIAQVRDREQARERATAYNRTHRANACRVCGSLKCRCP